jgi:hypothetical protein
MATMGTVFPKFRGTWMREKMCVTRELDVEQEEALLYRL